jgi:hypothetical protein
LLEEPDLAGRLGNAGADSVRREFASGSAIAALEAIYDHAAGRSV